MNLFRKKNITSINVATGDNILKRTLKIRDLTSFGIAAIVGAGIYGTIGTASANGGPAVVLLFIFTAIACLFSALCYAQFSASIPAAGSAYTYSYVAFGEIIAWIIGWDLVMEYAIGNIAVSISWSDYFTSLCAGLGVTIPSFLTMDYFSAYKAASNLPDMLPNPSDIIAQKAWASAPVVGGIKIVFDLPAFFINLLITAIVYVGIQESKKINNILVGLKLSVILLVVAVGFFYVTPSNWLPFAPNGVSGVLKGVSAVFFAYIGFDAISTTAEECINPQRDLPRSMIYSLGICTLLYVLVTLVLTGMVPFNQLNVGDPLSFVFQQHGLDFLSGLVAVSAVISMASVLLVFQLGQPRIWMSMSRDGLLPPIFSSIHPKFKTPWFSTIIAGIVVALPSMFMNLTEVTDLCSIGTLFAFVLVCAGVLTKPMQESGNKFRVYYINGKWIIPLIAIGIWGYYIFELSKSGTTTILSLNLLPEMIFLFIVALVAVLAILKSFSLIPVLGIYTNLYLMTALGITNWSRFGIWLLIGLVIYFFYGRYHSKLNK